MPKVVDVSVLSTLSNIYDRKQSLKDMFFKIAILKDFAIFTGKWRSTSFIKVAGLKACNFIKKRLQHKCFPVNIAKF